MAINLQVHASILRAIALAKSIDSRAKLPKPLTTLLKAQLTEAAAVALALKDVDVARYLNDAFVTLPPYQEDTTPPSNVSKPVGALNGSNQPTWTWAAATDDRGVASYVVRVNGSATEINVFATAFVYTTAVPGAYQLEVKALDGAGNRSVAWSTISDVVTVIGASTADVTAPAAPAQPTQVTINDTPNPPTFRISIPTVADSGPGGTIISGTRRYPVELETGPSTGVYTNVGYIPHPASQGAVSKRDIGSPAVSGSDNGSVMVAQTGEHYGITDQLYFKSQPWQGDFDAYIDITSMTSVSVWPKGGLEARSGDDPGAQYVNHLWFGTTNGRIGEQRLTIGGAATQATRDTSAAGLAAKRHWLKRRGNFFERATSDIGSAANYAISDTVELPNAPVIMDVGHFACSQDIANAVTVAYSAYAIAAPATVIFDGTGQSSTGGTTTLRVRVKSEDYAGNVSAASTVRSLVFASDASAPITGGYSPWLAGAPFGGSPRAYDSDAFIAQAARCRVVFVGYWDGWQGGRTRTMKQVCDAIHALNPNTIICVYYDALLAGNPVSSGAADYPFYQRMNASNYWLRTPNFSGGSIVAAAWWDAARYGTANVFDSAYRAYLRDYVLDYSMNGNAAGLSVYPNAVNDGIGGFFADDLYTAAPVNGDWLKNGGIDSGLATDLAMQTALVDCGTLLKAAKPGTIWVGNLSQFGRPDITQPTNFVNTLDGGLMESMLGETYSVETWGQLQDLLDYADRQSNVVKAAGRDTAIVFQHNRVLANGTDAYESVPYRASRYGFALAMAGPNYGWGYSAMPSGPSSYDVTEWSNVWFDEYDIDSTGNCRPKSAGGKGGWAGTLVGRSWLNGEKTLLKIERQNAIIIVNGRGATRTAPIAAFGGASFCKRPRANYSGAQDPTFNTGADITSDVSMPARSAIIGLKKSVFG